MKLWLPPYLSIRETDNGLRLGTLPPVAWHVESTPEFLPSLIRRCAEPMERERLVGVASELSGWSRAESEALIADLEDARVLVPAPEGRDRYDRHGLFYQLMGVDHGAQERLADLTVGLIGMGGIGTHLALHLAAAGVGRLVISDGDRVELSNLTRQTLFTEADVGGRKVDVAAERLIALRSDLDVTVIPEPFTSPTLAERVAAQSDIVLLSADRPVDVHLWASRACEAVGVPFSASGYIEGHGSVGPLLFPPSTPCFSCIREQAESLPPVDGTQEPGAATVDPSRELNPHWQAPSFGPLNALVAAAQANEALRWALGLPATTLGKRLLIDSRTYDLTWEEFTATGDCAVCGKDTGNRETTWEGIPDQYAREREDRSFNAILLDSLVPTLVEPVRGRSVADVGAGAGQLSARLADLGARVDAYEPDQRMVGLLRRRVEGNDDRVRIVPQGLEALDEAPNRYDVVYCLNVLDHVVDLEEAAHRLRSSVRPGGHLVLSIPHPMKDRGGWYKVPGPYGWEYRHYVVDDYFLEGECLKNREDDRGDVRIRGVRTYHRTLSRYFEEFLRQGMLVRRVLEPEPDGDVRERLPILFDKSSRIPYFVVIVLERGADA